MNEPIPILLTLFGIVTFVSPVERKHPSSMISRPSLNITDVRFSQSSNALSPIFVTLFGITAFRILLSSKQDSSMYRTHSGSTTTFICLLLF